MQFEDKVVDQLVSFMLSFNLHHYDNNKNAILQALASYSTPKVFTEHMMVLINRGGKFRISFGVFFMSVNQLDFWALFNRPNILSDFYCLLLM